MRFLLVALLMMLWIPGEAAARVVYEDGPFTVREVKDADKIVCKLEISMNMDGRIAAYLGLFRSSKYYGELFTERRRIGQARGKVTIGFDSEPPTKVKFVPDSPGMDTEWRWQYLDMTNPGQMLDNVARKRAMQVGFFNGKQNFSFTIPLKGSSKAVKRLKRCSRR
uniref:Uncharacterized protein n=1 Tax=Magnetococcus massalia (strain MO-1) TaxID=451514 RepID=A0A1S7LPM9_MAGMO|nr:conserved exported protein of unknown function [Candidatus Magnetococcus massalia]